ncbi:hypothetical protein [Romboutsia sp.]|uniref:hypothetical protein n=1 Tax=Romboutsia sp. TaxID=1965302 RepID=UPI002B8E595F|nr:hypothetical protein [Romboutsia sp.]HSQ90165.1 hypothetical protein [Romboutsia sp.]
MYEIRKNTTLKQTILPYHESMKKKYFMLHKELFYTDMSVDEILVYAYLVDKRNLSQFKADNDDLTYVCFEENDVYIVVSNQELMDFMKIKGKPKIIAIKKMLEDRGLIKQVRQFDNSNKIYVYDYEFESIEK